MTEATSTAAATRPGSPLRGLLFLVVFIAVGAHVSGIPLLLAKAGVAPLLVLAYGFATVRTVTPLDISSARTRGLVGLALGAVAVYATWVVRIPAFSGWETAITADPRLVWSAVLERAGSMQVTRGLGHGTSAEGPSWLLLGTYAVEAAAFVGVAWLAALLSSPETPASEDDAQGASAQERRAA